MTVQDIASANRTYLETVADEVLIGPLEELPVDERFDLVLSTFVYEHVVQPHRFLDRCLDALRPGGLLAIFSPKYVVPGYVPPALRHLGRFRQHWLAAGNAAAGVRTRLTRRQRFPIVLQPAVPSVREFFRDSDAVHLVQPLDATLHLMGRAEARPLPVPCLSLKDWLWQRLALNAQAFRKL